MAYDADRERAALDTEDFMTRDEVAELFRVTPRTVDRWRQKGALHPVKAGHFNLYGKDEVLSLLNGKSADGGRFKFADNGRLIDTGYVR